MEFIQAQVVKYPDLADSYTKLSDLFDRRLWHQLTGALQDLVADAANAKDNGQSFIELYEGFISAFESKMNQLQLAQILVTITPHCRDASQALQLYQSLLEKETRLGAEAALLLKSEMCLVKLQHHEGDEKELASIKEVVVKGQAALDDELHTADPSVRSSFYKLASEYYKKVGPPEAFYRAGLKYLAYTSLEKLADDVKFQLATDLALAAISGADVFNFGEVLATPALGLLEGTSNEWLGKLLVVFNRGDIDGFNAVIADHKKDLEAQPALMSHADFIKEKVALLCLMCMVFERPSHERNMPFADIAARTKLPLDQVEWLVMRAMSLGLVRGIMDDIEQTLHVSWVQPRVLDTVQLTQMAKRLDAWQSNVQGAFTYVEEQTPELFG